MRAQLMERIAILRNADMISAFVAGFCQETVDYLLQTKPDAEEERLAMLITHLAMGTQRLVDHKDENPIDQGILEAIKKEPQFPEAELLAETIIDRSGIPFSQTETDFLIIHLCNLLS